MKTSYKSLALAILLNVVCETLTEITEDPIRILSPLTGSDYKQFHNDLMRQIAKVVAAHRKKIYDVISSEKFIRTYPVMKKIMRLPVSNLKKSIIFLAGIGCTTLEISHILQSEKCSVSTMRSTCRQYIAEIFRH